MELSGRVALVTGAGSGIGAAAAVKLAEAGADIAVLSRSRDEMKAVAGKIRSLGRKSHVITASIADAAAAAQDAFSQVVNNLGRLDVLFANAGINGTWVPIEQLKPEEWDETMSFNLRGTFLCLHEAVPLMKARGGSIIINSSINGTRPFTTAGASAYATSKARQLALG
jgi:NAD(P)-dependent dehydrogenase (short-subunit alcohol dehydrogenase family)